jgi:signal recognition particle subunit SRP54
MRYDSPMFDRLTSGLTRALNALSGRGYLSEDNIADTVREVRLALLDADVALPVDKRSSTSCTRSSCASWASRAPDSICVPSVRWS